jgi:hypothetical protein
MELVSSLVSDLCATPAVNLIVFKFLQMGIRLSRISATGGDPQRHISKVFLKQQIFKEHTILDCPCNGILGSNPDSSKNVQFFVFLIVCILNRHTV